MESYTDPNTGVTEYTLEVGSNRCSIDAPHDVRIRVGGTELQETASIQFQCPPVAEDGVEFSASPSHVEDDGTSTSQISVKVIDICGNPAIGQTVTVEKTGDVATSATLSNTELTTQDAIDTPSEGVAVAEASCSQEGTLGITVTIEDQTFTSSADLVTFTKNLEPDAGN